MLLQDDGVTHKHKHNTTQSRTQAQTDQNKHNTTHTRQTQRIKHTKLTQQIIIKEIAYSTTNRSTQKIKHKNTTK
jgi:hypothetical protein